MGFNHFLGLRVTRVLQARYLRLTEQPAHRERTEAALYRMALEDWCAAQEKELGLPPIETVSSTPSADAAVQVLQSAIAQRAVRRSGAKRGRRARVHPRRKGARRKSGDQSKRAGTAPEVEKGS